MRNKLLLLVLAAVMVVGPVAVQAGPPVAGTYKSTNGDFDEGTATTTWAGGGYLSASNVLYGRSTSGGLFTNDWTVSCPIVVSAVPLGPPIGPNGNFIYMINYTGGYLTLGGPGNPWDGGDATYTGTIDTYIEIRTIQVVGGLITGATSDHSVSAHLQGYNDTCMSWAIGNGVLRGAAPAASFAVPPLQNAKPADYPDFPNALCQFGIFPGHWDDIRDLTLSITGCAVKTQQSTWGAVKSMYRN